MLPYWVGSLPAWWRLGRTAARWPSLRRSQRRSTEASDSVSACWTPRPVGAPDLQAADFADELVHPRSLFLTATPRPASLLERV